MSYTSARLTAEHDTARFACGHETLDRWLREQALGAEQARVSATTVWTPVGEARVVGFYSVSPTLLRRDELPSRSMAGGYSEVPGYLLGRLALDQTLHRKHLGSQLLLDALELIVEASARSGGRVIVVDAIDDLALAFYEHHDFVRIAQTRRLVMKVATARHALRR